MLRSNLENVARHWRRAHEGNRFNTWMCQQRIDTFASSVDKIKNALRQSRAFKEFCNFYGGERHFFAWFKHECIAANQRHRIHPKRHHCWKIERRDAHANSQRLANRVTINTASKIFDALSHQ